MRTRWIAVIATVATMTACAGPKPPALDAGPAAVTLTRGELLSPSAPVRIEIPALDVAVPVAELGLRADGTMEVPSDAKTVGWFTGSPTPGALGPAVLAGHVDYRGAAGTFARLDELARGDKIRVTRQDNTIATFTVTGVSRYPKDRFPTETVYGPIDHAGLRLITCGGDFDRRTGHYEDNVVAYAETASPDAT